MIQRRQALAGQLSPLLLTALMLAALLLWSTRSHARRYPISASDASGTWIGTRRGLLHGSGELWQRYDDKTGLPSATITDLELTARSVWVATPAGLARLDKGSRRWETFGPPQLPAAEVTAVSVDRSDPDHVWVGTSAGLAHHNVRTNKWWRFGPADGLPGGRVNDVLFRGRTVWVATDAGLAAHDVKLNTWTVYRKKDGLPDDRVLEIDEQGAELWLSCASGVAQLSPQRRTFTAFGKAQGFPGGEVRAQAAVQNLLYLVTDAGLITYDTTAGSLAPFTHAAGLQGAAVRGVTSAGGFVWFATDRGLARFDPTKKSWEYYRIEDGLSSEDLATLGVAGGFLLVFGRQGTLDSYDYKRDEWIERSGLLPPSAGTEQPPASQPTSGPVASSQPAVPEKKEPPRLKLSVSAELDSELKQDLIWSRREPFEREGHWLINTLRLGTGIQWASGRKLDISGKIDWGDISPLFDGEGSSLETFQRYDFEARYLGLRDDWLQEATVSDELRLAPEGGRLTEATELEGGRVVLAAGPRRGAGRLTTLSVSAGLRRGTPARVVFRRPSVAALQIKRFKLLRPARDGAGGTRETRFVIPSSVRALLDGRELERNVDYFVDHDNGVLWLKNTDLIHALRVLEVEFEYEQIPHKNVGAVSLSDLLPRDGDIGQLTRSGRARWARDEQALFDEIDGGAEQFINRGWARTLSQDFEWNSAGVVVRIYDMDDEKNARSIFIARRLPDAKPIPGLPEVFIERQSATLTVKLLRGQFYIEIAIDQPSMEQEITAVAGWLVSKLEASGATAADDLRDLVTSAGWELQLGERTRIGFDYIGTLSIDDETIARREGVSRRALDLFALHAHHARKLGAHWTLDGRLQAAGSTLTAEEVEGRKNGGGLLGQLLLTSPTLVLRAQGRKYAADYAGIGLARQTEFCRGADGRCTRPGQSRLDHELGADATLRALDWLPLALDWQRQWTALGSDYAGAIPTGGRDSAVRDIAGAQLGLERGDWPKLVARGELLRRDSPLFTSWQWRSAGSLEADLGRGWLAALALKKIYLRGLYEYGDGEIDEHGAEQLDRDQTMHHAVGELRLAPTLTENGYATIEYHRLRGVRDASREVVDRLAYWRVDTGAGSSVIPGLALRFDGTFWFGDDQPPPISASMVQPLPDDTEQQAQRQQEAESRLSGVVDCFFGEWVDALSPLRLNAAYTFTRQSAALAQRTATVPFGEEVCDVAGDEDGDGLSDCADPDCALAAICLQRTSEVSAHRTYGTVTWDTPGKLQAEVFGDLRLSHAGAEQTLRSTRIELRSFVTWRPVYPSPITLRFDLLDETQRPEQYDGIEPLVEPAVLTLEPALEWRRRWSARWWHLAKLSVTHTRTRSLPHVRTVEDSFGRQGELERLDFDEWAVKPSVELRHRVEDPQGRWNFRPYLRASYRLRLGRGRGSCIGDCSAGRSFGPDDPGFVDGSEESQLISLTLGLIWVYAENIFVDLDLTGALNDCRRAPSGSRCNDQLTLSPFMLATMRY